MWTQHSGQCRFLEDKERDKGRGKARFSVEGESEEGIVLSTLHPILLLAIAPSYPVFTQPHPFLLGSLCLKPQVSAQDRWISDCRL